MTAPASSDHGQLDPGGARFAVRIGQAVDLDARITVAGLLAVGALLSGTLLCSAAIVLAARRGGRLPAGERSERAADRPRPSCSEQ